MVQYVAVCDVDRNHRNAAKQMIEEYYAQQKQKDYQCATYNDFREVLARR